MNEERISKLRPAILLVLRTSIDGAIQYRRVDLEQDHDENGARVAKWETTRTVRDPEEYGAAVQARGDARNVIIRACSVSSAFGLMAPLAEAETLGAAIREARGIVNAFNETARTCRVGLQALRGEIAQSDEEAARAITGEVKAMLRDMEAGIMAADPKKIRDAATEAKALAAVLSDETREKVSAAVAEARTAAREIVRRVGKAGETAAAVIAELDLEALRSASASFLDLDETEEPVSLAPVSSAVDLSDEPAPVRRAAPVNVPLFMEL